jgi:two-component system, OmpR family, sensor kinase
MILPRTIRWRIQVLYAALFAVLIALLAISSYREQQAQYIASVDSYLNLQIRYMLPRFFSRPGAPPPREPGLPPPNAPGDSTRREQGSRVLENAETQRQTRGGYFILFKQGIVAEKSNNAPQITAPIAPPDTIDITRWHEGRREAVHISPGGDTLVAGLPAESLQAGLGKLRWQLLLPALGALVIGILGGWAILHHGLRPLRRMSREASDIASGRRDTRIANPADGTELTQLATTLNSTFDRLDDSYERQKRFTADASHELGNPLAVIISQTQLALSRPRENTDYIAALESCARAGQRMKTLTRDLLDLAEYDAGIPANRMIPCDLAEIAREAIAELHPLIENKKAEIIEDLQSSPGFYHPAAVSQVFTNLIANAIKHNLPGTRVTITVSQNETGTTAQVHDNGCGIPADDLPKLFERFHRAEKSRTSEGSGLGLAICRTILQAHHATITATNHPTGGAAFHVTFSKDRS